MLTAAHALPGTGGPPLGTPVLITSPASSSTTILLSRGSKSKVRSCPLRAGFRNRSRARPRSSAAKPVMTVSWPSASRSTRKRCSPGSRPRARRLISASTRLNIVTTRPPAWCSPSASNSPWWCSPSASNSPRNWKCSFSADATGPGVSVSAAAIAAGTRLHAAPLRIVISPFTATWDATEVSVASGLCDAAAPDRTATLLTPGVADVNEYLAS